MKKWVLLGVAICFLCAGTCYAATSVQSDLVDTSGVSFGQTAVTDGNLSGNTLYVVTGGYSQADMVGATGVSIYEVSPEPTALNTLNLNVAFQSLAGANGYDASSAATVSPSSPVLIDNGAGGNSIFFVANVYDTNTAAGDGTSAITGFVLYGLSADSDGTETLSVKVDSEVTNMAVWSPLAWTDNGLVGGTLTGTSLFFGTVMAESGSSPAMVNNIDGIVAGSTVYVVNTTAAFQEEAIIAANNNVNAAYEPGVSGFYCGPVISENANGVSVYMVGLNGTLGTGNTLFCYDGGSIDGDVDLGAGAGGGWVIGPHEAAGLGGVTIFATPGLGMGNFNVNSNLYSGNSLFVVDGQGGVSVYDKSDGSLDLATTYGENNGTTTGGATYAGPVSNGQYLVLCNDNGVTVYTSGTTNQLTDGNSSNWLWRTGDMTVANGWTRNWRIYATPMLSNGRVVVAVAAPDTFGTERVGPGRVFMWNLNQTAGSTIGPEDTEDLFNLTSSGVASPIASDDEVWIQEYNSAIYRITMNPLGIDAFPWSYQFKVGPDKTGDNSEGDNNFVPGSSGTCFISTIK